MYLVASVFTSRPTSLLACNRASVFMLMVFMYNVTILTCGLMMIHEHILSFLYIYYQEIKLHLNENENQISLISSISWDYFTLLDI